MSVSRSVMGWLLLVMVALATVAMHTQLSGGCPHPGSDVPGMTAAPVGVMAATAAHTTDLMHDPEQTAPVMRAGSVTTAGPAGPFGSGMGAGMGQVCQATVPAAPATQALALAALILVGLFAGPLRSATRRWWWARWWWPPPVGRAALGIWRI